MEAPALTWWDITSAPALLEHSVCEDVFKGNFHLLQHVNKRLNKIKYASINNDLSLQVFSVRSMKMTVLHP